MTTQTDELLAFYAAEFERETGCKWTVISGICQGSPSAPHNLNTEEVLQCPHARVPRCAWARALNGNLKYWIKGAVRVVEDYSAEPIGIAEWHRRVVEMRK